MKGTFYRLITLCFLSVGAWQPVAAQTTIFSEDFESAASTSLLPNLGWQEYEVSAGNSRWALGTAACAITGTKSLFVARNVIGNPCDYAPASASNKIAYKTFSTVGYTSLTLDFNWVCNGEKIGSTYYDFGRVCYSLDGTTWTNLPDYYQGQTTTQSVTNLALPTALENQPTVYLGFRWVNDITTKHIPGFVVDDIAVKGTSSGGGCTAPPAPTAATATPNPVYVGQSFNLSATSAGNTIYWFTTASGGSSFGNSPSGGNVARSEASPGTYTYYAESNTAGSGPSGNMLNSPTPTSTSSGNWTLGYSFTPSTNLTVTGVRSYFGTKVSVWTNTGTLVFSQPVSATPGTWTETPLGSPVTLTAGTTYRIGAYTNFGTYNWAYGLPSTFTGGTINTSYEISGDNFPTSTDGVSWWFVDLAFGGTGCPSATRTPVTVTVNGPEITATSPGTACVNTPATLSATVAPSNATVKWYSVPTGGTALFTGLTFTTPPLSVTTTYYAEPTITVGSVTTAGPRVAVVATVVPGVSITTQPVAQVVCTGSPLTLSVTATNGTSYQWYQDGSPVPGATSATYTVLSAAPAQSGNYYVSIGGTSPCAAVSSNTVSVLVTSGAAITTQPSNQSVCAGSALTLSVGASGATGYQWYHNGNAIPGATGAAYTVPNATTADAGTYYVIAGASGCGDATSLTATVTVNPVAQITTQPTAQNICEGSPLSLSATATGAVSYQWYHDGSPIPGATSNAYTISAADVADGGSYYLVASSAFCGDATSTTVAVVVTPLPNAAIAYPLSAFCTSAATQSVTLSGTPGGTFSAAPSGLSIDPATGDVDAAASTPGIYTITYTVAPAGGCAAFSTTTSVEIYPTPTITAQPVDATFCVGQPLTLSVAATDALFYQWYAGGTPIPGATASTYTIPVTTAADAGLYFVVINDCAISDVITVSEEPAAVAGMISVSGIPPGFDFTAVGSAGSLGQVWDFGDGTTATGDPVSHAYAANGVYTITLVVTNLCGQTDTAQMNLVVTGTGVEDIGGVDGSVLVYPNPATVQTIVDGRGQVISRVEVLDAMGRVVLQQAPAATQANLNVAGLARGVYTLRVQTATGTSILRLQLQ